MKGLKVNPVSVKVVSETGLLNEHAKGAVEMVDTGYLAVCHIDGRASKLDAYTTTTSVINNMFENTLHFIFNKEWEDMDENDGTWANLPPLQLSDFNEPGKLRATWFCCLNDDAPLDAELGKARFKYHLEDGDVDLEVSIPLILDGME
ncbi:hypothetical protein [Vibrio phage vB_VmeM-Yong XC32]|nr:hypothetical protein [Vibrio phage vB_VmeM-Yong XC31]QAX96509.1 hypothetical protein [Vibrio phage vB_VmeM-Yong XC32]QAX96826.1 hypothetical protein [Vibrio phage vB_VmeM-Yong MS31]